jgi:hypothetical protein
MQGTDSEPMGTEELSCGYFVYKPSRSQWPRGRSSTEIVGWNPTQGMDVCLRLSCVCVASGLATG